MGIVDVKMVITQGIMYVILFHNVQPLQVSILLLKSVHVKKKDNLL